ncbi:hypothetical protein B4U45_17650 [Mycobacterium persicum]|uniref:Uncharacterized protein n=1 Tax=Mycobacterium persicum TaxID=1487726 RepID=A0A8E2LP46_9MYCO|nr:hypothetical protein A4G31_16655 [Mycobacterium persicum]ORB48056.1 hypothetical protein BST40_14455 [Mycobacterium persicum]ORB90750.1 hypothetical protein B1T49_17615 [Mycobacterium persicum]ORB96132.1 hypothetical protein B1T44_18330 [Mycobacterium persicum]ORC02840.1 hypothetical protein B1T48_17850 [Mycobacterium persicum]
MRAILVLLVSLFVGVSSMPVESLLEVVVVSVGSVAEFPVSSVVQISSLNTSWALNVMASRPALS